jgi:hypothetical protein
MRVLAIEMDFDHMDDGGMYVWAGIMAVAGLAASYLIALAWQRRKARRQKDG